MCLYQKILCWFLRRSRRNIKTEKIGSYGIIALIIANMIGTGVFTTSGYALAAVGDPFYVMGLWVLGGVLALCGAISYAALGRKYRESGGEYYILKESLGPFAGYLTGWISLFAGFTAPIATAALALEAYAGLEGSIWLGAFVIIFSGLLHTFSPKSGLGFQLISVSLKLIAIFFFLAYSMSFEFHFDEASMPFEFNGWASFGVSLVWVTFAFSGWNAALYVTSELKDINKDLMKSTIKAVLIVVATYIMLNLVFLFGPPLSEVTGEAEIAKIAAFYIGGSLLERFISVVICIALITSISSMTLVGPRVYSAMAKDGFLPKMFNGAQSNPRNALFLQMLLALAALTFSNILELMSYIGFMLGLSSTLTVGCVFLKENRAVAKHIPLYPVTPILFMVVTVFSSGFLIYSKPLQALFGMLTVSLGIFFYFISGLISKKV